MVRTSSGRSRVSSEQEGGKSRRGYELLGRKSEGDWRELEVEGSTGLRETETPGANPYLPTGYMVSTWWVLKQNTQHGPTRPILITFVICPQFAWSNTHWVHVEYFQKVPTTEPAKGGLDLPTGSILIAFVIRPHFTHPNTHRAHIEYFYKVPTQIPTHWGQTPIYPAGTLRVF